MGNARNVIGDVRPFAVLSDAGRTRVYKGYQPALDRFVLLKVLKAGGDEALVQRFEEEARLVARVQHPNVVAVHTCGRDEGRVYLTAEFVEGADLRELLKGGPLPPELASFIALQAARGLEAAHARDVLHRDFKPANLLIATDGQVKVADFGMASLHRAAESSSAERGGGAAVAEIRGTPAYLAPEQLLGQAPAPPADFFALGATLYEMLAGRPAFAGAGTEAVLDAILHHDPMEVLSIHADVPVPLRRVSAELLAKNPAERSAHGADVIAEVEAARETLGFTAGQAELAAYVDDPAGYQPPARPSPNVAADAPGTHSAKVPSDVSEGPTAFEEAAPARRRTFALAALGLLLAAGLGYAGLAEWDGLESDVPAITRTASREAAPRRGERRPRVTGGEPVQPDPLPARSADSTGGAASPLRAEESPPPPAQTTDARPAPDALRHSNAPPTDSPEASKQEYARSSMAGESAPAEDAWRAPARAAGPEEDATGRLRMMSVPAAVVYVDGDSVGVTPTITPLELEAGVHRLALKHPRLPVYRDTVRVAAGRLAERSVALWAQVARLTVEVSPWAEVLVDGAVRDTTPLRRPLVLSPGAHTVTLRHPALGVWERRLRLRPGAQDTISVNLLK